MFKNIEVQNFRSIKKLRIENAKQINLIVGDNNTGKTTLLESLFLLINPSNRALPIVANNLRGFPYIDESGWKVLFYSMEPENTILLKSILKNNEERRLLITPSYGADNPAPINYDASLRKKYINPSTSNEIVVGVNYDLAIKKKGKTQKFKETIDSSTIVPGKPVISNSAYKEYLTGRFLKLNNPTASYGHDLNQILKSPALTKELITTIKKVIKFELYGFQMIGDFLYCDVGFKYLLPISFFGDGLISLIRIISNLILCKNGIILIDEVEFGLHYSHHEDLWKVILDLSTKYNIQIFATTHSDSCIKSLNSLISKRNTLKKDILLFRLEKHKTEHEVIRYDYELLNAAIENHFEFR